MRLRRLFAASAVDSVSSDLPDRILVDAPAKINLTLEVVGRRADGYHELRSLMVAIDLCDELEFRASTDDQLSLTCDVPELSTGEDNLILRAARLLQEIAGSGHGAMIHLTKRIPWGAGLGGGSSDAASTLVGLNALWNLNCSMGELAELGNRLGSDVGFFFATPVAWCWGRGEQTRPMKLGSPLTLVLVCPGEVLATPRVFAELGCTRQTEPVVSSDPPEALAEALALADVAELRSFLRNDLEEPAMRLSPRVRAWSERLKQVIADRSSCRMSGSGSSLFALCSDHREALQVYEDLRRGPPSEGTENARILIVRTCED